MGLNIRPVRLEDFWDISRIRKMDGVMENILANPDESEEKVISKIMNITKNDYWFIAELDEIVVGLATLNKYVNPRKNHAAQMSIMVDSNYHSKGIGTALMEELTRVSDSILKLKRLELFVFADNKKAIGLYKKFGFQVEGVQKYSALKNGVYADELMMARILED